VFVFSLEYIDVTLALRFTVNFLRMFYIWRPFS